MSETLTTPPAKADVQPAAQEIAPMSAEREAILRRLLDEPYAPYDYGNFEYARASGLIDMFRYDPVSGKDSLVHILSGDVWHRIGQGVVGGFHHERSGAYAPPGQEPSWVDTSRIDTLKPRDRRRSTPEPFEPYDARVVIDGVKKVTTQADRKGRPQVVPAITKMFPKEYDTLLLF